MKRRLFLKGFRDGLLLMHCGNVIGAPAIKMWDGEKSVGGERHVKLLIAGDVMTGRGIDQIMPHPSVATLYESYVRDAGDYVSLAERKNGPIPRRVDYDYIWGEALDVWNSIRPDLRIINLETSVTTSDDFWPSKGIHYRMHPQNVPCLASAEIDCCVLANNHVLDWGQRGLKETLATLHKSGLKTAGAGRNIDQAVRPARLKVPGRSDILVFAFADSSSGVPVSWRAGRDRCGVNLLKDLSVRTARQVVEQILAQRKHDELVVASIHWGRNWGYDVPLRQQRFAHYLVDHGGVDILHGHSSHHAKAIETYNGKLILYGCGDFLNDYEGIGGQEEYRPWLAPMYFVTMGATSRAFESLEIVSMQLQRFRLIQATRQDRQWLSHKLNKISKGFGTAFEMRNSSMVMSSLPR
jgi:poly-gamma-glutamate synthesis protein (capsule biosynthesis protein)